MLGKTYDLPQRNAVPGSLDHNITGKCRKMTLTWKMFSRKRQHGLATNHASVLPLLWEVSRLLTVTGELVSWQRIEKVMDPPNLGTFLTAEEWATSVMSIQSDSVAPQHIVSSHPLNGGSTWKRAISFEREEGYCKPEDSSKVLWRGEPGSINRRQCSAWSASAGFPAAASVDSSQGPLSGL